MNLKEIRELMELMREMSVSELEVERSGTKIRIKTGRDANELTASMFHPPGMSAEEIAAARRTSVPAAPPAPEPPVERGLVIQSPIVGTFYRSASPDGANYVEVGDLVKKGQILCIVEAMKLMNEIEAEVDGRVLEVMVENARPVDYGQPLFRIDPVPAA
jgi:acetyl-CoA carboxylase biotin carboxyl carrier protein